MTPKAFISYSWASPEHQGMVREWAERLAADGVDVVLDVYDLREGQDKFAYMERMVVDSTVTHVLVVSDATYATKADRRDAGVGTESQIISAEVYKKVDQTKFVALVCGFDDQGEAYLPTYLKSRIWLDFSAPEKVNANWERLIRHLHGQPLYAKPQIGSPPQYLTSSPAATTPAKAKFETFKNGLLSGHKGVHFLREDFLAALFAFADSLRTRAHPEPKTLAADIVGTVDTLKASRNLLTDWLLLEASSLSPEELEMVLPSVLERLIALKPRPAELQSFNDSWFGAHSIFVYESFLYIVAALLRTAKYQALHEVFTSHYLKPEEDYSSSEPFVPFTGLWGSSVVINEVLAEPGRRFYSPTGELLNRNSDRPDITWPEIMQADLLCYLMSILTDRTYWYPHTLNYAGYSQPFPFFVRAAQHRHFKHLVTITGVTSAEALRAAVKSGLEENRIVRSEGLYHINFWSSLNMDRLDTIK